MQEEIRNALLKACQLVGGQKQLAKQLQIDPSRLNKWINRNKRSVPYEFAIRIEELTHGRVTCKQLLPKWQKVVEHVNQRGVNCSLLEKKTRKKTKIV
jgi:DNA-binding transcriptional regulator YdaS (Cro superfamily)